MKTTIIVIVIASLLIVAGCSKAQTKPIIVDQEHCDGVERSLNSYESVQKVQYLETKHYLLKEKARCREEGF